MRSIVAVDFIFPFFLIQSRALIAMVECADKTMITLGTSKIKREWHLSGCHSRYKNFVPDGQ
jgi:hypothetical protein